jgi:hypothetical protein
MHSTILYYPCGFVSIQSYLREKIGPFFLKHVSVTGTYQTEISQDCGIIQWEHNASAVLKSIPAALNKQLSIFETPAT